MPSAAPTLTLSDADLLDWSKPVASGVGLSAFAPFDQHGAALALPQDIVIATNGAGEPDFRLALVRPDNPALPPEPYTSLEFRLRARTDINQALLSGDAPFEGLRVAPLRRGVLVLRRVQALDVPEALLQPIALSWNGLGASNIALRLSAHAGSVLRAALNGGHVLLNALAEIEIAGVAPRLPVSVNFSTKAFFGILQTMADAEGRLARQDVEALFVQQLASLPIVFSADIASFEPHMLAATLADHVMWQWGDLAASPRRDAQPAIQLPDQETILAGTTQWSLIEPIVARRTLVLAFDPLAAARNLATATGDNPAVVEITVPGVATGFHRVNVHANLPSPRLGVAMLGANIRFPAFAPGRPQEIKKTLAFTPAVEGGDIDIRLAPDEPLSWLVSTFALFPKPHGREQIVSDERAGQGPLVALGPDDVPVRFVELELSAALAAIASVNGGIAGTHNGLVWNSDFTLNAQNRRGAVVLPRDLLNAVLNLTAVAREDAREIVLPPQAARDIFLDLHHLPGFGGHKVLISCSFDSAAPLVSVELLAETAASDSAEIVAFTPLSPTREWHWLAHSPFKSGFRWRWHSRGAAWSDVVAPGADLALRSSDADISALGVPS